MTGRARLGVVIGKFLPPHAGHSHLIDTAAAGCDRLLVIVCSRDGDPIPAATRAGWISQLHPGVEVVVTADDIPDHDPRAREEGISRAWADRTRALCGQRFGHGPGVVFTSEEYGPRYARYLGAEHVGVDPDRARFPVSGTAVRADPFAAWEFLHPVVRAWYVRRVCVVGAESTGTTTLARDLAEHFGCPWVPEYGRTFCEEQVAALTGTAMPADHGSGPGTAHVPDPPGAEVAVMAEIRWRSEDFARIAARQLADEDAAARSGAKLIVCDTDALATSIWHERYLGTPSPEVDRLAASRRYDLYLLTGDEIPFVQDGTRDGEHLRARMTERFRQKLSTRPEPWIEVTGSRTERLATAVAAVTPLLTYSASDVRTQTR